MTIRPHLFHWRPRPRPTNRAMEGRLAALEPLTAVRHAADLWAAFGGATNPGLWTYLPGGPFEDEGAFRAWLEQVERRDDWVSFAVLPAETGRPAGIANYMRIDEANGAAEVGSIIYGAGLARRPAATEAMMLMAARIFDGLGYRRYEWKCDADNAPSRRAALRLGFRFEGVFRQHQVVKGRNRDTAWYSILDIEWPAVRAALARWLAPENFGPNGAQKSRLGDLTSVEACANPVSGGETGR